MSLHFTRNCALTELTAVRYYDPRLMLNWPHSTFYLKNFPDGRTELWLRLEAFRSPPASYFIGVPSHGTQPANALDTLPFLEQCIENGYSVDLHIQHYAKHCGWHGTQRWWGVSGLPNSLEFLL